MRSRVCSIFHFLIFTSTLFVLLAVGENVSNVFALPSGNPSLADGNWFVSPAGAPTNSGKFDSPWDLQTALNHPSSVKPGDTIWLRGGTYLGGFYGRINGSPTQPIIIRQYPGERVILDGNNQKDFPKKIADTVLMNQGSYVWYWGFEIMSSALDRDSTEPVSWPTVEDVPSSNGIDNYPLAPTALLRGVKYINLIIHDVKNGVALWSTDSDTEASGCLVYNNGWQGPDRGHGHGFYIQNNEGGKYIKDNIIFQGFALGIQAYGSSNAYLNNLHFDGNVFFNAGLLSDKKEGSNFLVGGGRMTEGAVVTNNYTYNSPTTYSQSFNLGYEPFGAGSNNSLVKDNYFARGIARFKTPMNNAIIEGNTFYSQDVIGLDKTQFSKNTFIIGTQFPDYPPVPSENSIFIRTNFYEPNRAHIVIYNWKRLTAVNVDVSTILKAGESYELRNAQNYFGDIIKGTYDGGLLSIPMTGRTVAAPYARPVPESTFPEFGLFVLIKNTETSTEIQKKIITATASPGGSINPSGTVNVIVGESQVFTIAPAAGYRIDKILIDGAGQTQFGSSYTFNNVTADHEIKVNFIAVDVPIDIPKTPEDPPSRSSNVTSSEKDSLHVISNIISPEKKEARFEFSLSSSDRVTIELYSLNGEVLLELFNADVLADQIKSVVWDGLLKNGARAPSGTYLIKAKLGGRQEIKKIVVVK